jgi:hypothetical protein
MRPHAAATDTGVQPQPASRLAVIASHLFAAVANRYPQRPAVGMSPASVAGSIYLAVESAPRNIPRVSPLKRLPTLSVPTRSNYFF